YPQSLLDFVEDVNRTGGTYHRIDFGGGLVMDGEYAMDEYWPLYGFPQSLAGLSVLDVGTASGYFAVECARRGADVTAIDIGDGGFQRTVVEGAGTSARYEQKDLFDLGEQFGTFDVVVCGSVLLHVWDQVGAMRRLRAVCRGLTIVATGIMPPERECDRFPAAELVGIRDIGGTGGYWTAR